MAFVHRADRIHLPLLPWDFFLSQVFTFGLRPPLLGPFRPGFSLGAMDVFASDPVTSVASRVPLGVVSGRRLAGPLVFTIGSAPCLRLPHRLRDVADTHRRVCLGNLL